jgi:hypothetical protein
VFIANSQGHQPQLGLPARFRRWLRAIRTKQVFLSPNPQATTAPPVFIIGVHRSGTTLFHKFERDVGNLEDPIASASNGFQPSLKNYLKLPADLLAKMVNEAGSTLSRLGYEVPQPG